MYQHHFVVFAYDQFSFQLSLSYCVILEALFVRLNTHLSDLRYYLQVTDRLAWFWSNVNRINLLVGKSRAFTPGHTWAPTATDTVRRYLGM